LHAMTRLLRVADDPFALVTGVLATAVLTTSDEAFATDFAVLRVTGVLVVFGDVVTVRTPSEMQYGAN
jgi:hypothetical protein